MFSFAHASIEIVPAKNQVIERVYKLQPLLHEDNSGEIEWKTSKFILHPMIVCLWAHNSGVLQPETFPASQCLKESMMF